jgi:hypothetical protein
MFGDQGDIRAIRIISGESVRRLVTKNTKIHKNGNGPTRGRALFSSVLLGGLARLRPVTSIERDRAIPYLEIQTLKTLTTFLFTRTKQSREQRRDGGEPFAPILELLGPV